MRKIFIAGNWKMYKNIQSSIEFAEEFKTIYTPNENVQVAIICPFLQIPGLKYEFNGTDILVGAQNMHFQTEGAFTGEISAEMLSEVGTDFCVIGHSERRAYFSETDETVNLKIKKALECGIVPIMCVGESLEQRQVGLEHITVSDQLKKGLAGLSSMQVQQITIAYEPIWAIGTGKTATAAQAEDMCSFIRSCVQEMFGEETAQTIFIQYGGSVKPANSAELISMPNIDGFLVGGASLNPKDFNEIIKNASCK